MVRYCMYETATGVLQSINLVSYATTMPAKYSEAAITPASRYHTEWNPETHTLDDNGGGKVLTDAEVYDEFKEGMKQAFNDFSSADRAKILSLAPEDIKKVVE